MNLHGIKAIYRFELARTWRTLLQSIAAPVLSTSLYFVVFGSAIGSRMTAIDGVSYGAFIVPGLMMLAILEHWFLVLPISATRIWNAMWQWSLGARSARVQPVRAPTVPREATMGGRP